MRKNDSVVGGGEREIIIRMIHALNIRRRRLIANVRLIDGWI